MKWEYVGVEVKFKIHRSTLQFGVMVRVVQQGRDAFLSYTSTTNMKPCDRGGSVRLHRDAPEGLFHHMEQLRTQSLLFSLHFWCLANRLQLVQTDQICILKKMHSHFSFISVTPELITATFNTKLSSSQRNSAVNLLTFCATFDT